MEEELANLFQMFEVCGVPGEISSYLNVTLDYLCGIVIRTSQEIGKCFIAFQLNTKLRLMRGRSMWLLYEKCLYPLNVWDQAGH